jgi:hypothetical protein
VAGVFSCSDDGFLFDAVVFQGEVLVLEFVPEGRFFRYGDIKIKRQKTFTEDFYKGVVSPDNICSFYESCNIAYHPRRRSSIGDRFCFCWDVPVDNRYFNYPGSGYETQGLVRNMPYGVSSGENTQDESLRTMISLARLEIML